MNPSERACRIAARTGVIRNAIEALDRRVFLAAHDCLVAQATNPVQHTDSPAGQFVAASADTTPPTVTAAEFVFDAFPTRQTVTLTFSEDVSQSLQEQDIALRNLTTAETVQENVFGI